MKLYFFMLVHFFAVWLCTHWWTAHAQQAIVLQEGGNGSAVVLLSIAHIQQSGSFADDNELLRRIAFVETRDGTTEDTYREGFDGGVWAVSREAFLDTQDTKNNPRLPGKFEGIREKFQIDWPSVTWRDLRRPLYSAIAARLVLFVAPTSIPQTSDIPAQAEFWMQYYNTGGSTANFIAAASELEGMFCYRLIWETIYGFTESAHGNDFTEFTHEWRLGRRLFIAP